MAVGREGCAGCAVGGRLVVLGGRTAGRSDGRPVEYLASVEVYDSKVNCWAHGPALPRGRYGASAAFLGGQLIVLGGADTSGAALNTVVAWEPASGDDQWVTLPQMEICRCVVGASVLAL